MLAAGQLSEIEKRLHPSSPKVNKIHCNSPPTCDITRLELKYKQKTVSERDGFFIGAGGTVFKLTEQGNRVSLCVLCGNADNRSYRPSTEALKENMNSATASIGISEIYCGTYKDSNLNAYPHNDIVRFIEDAIFESHSSCCNNKKI